MLTPKARGPLSADLFDALHGSRPTTGWDVASLDEDDLQLSLWALYELAYRGFDDVDAALEWDPGLLGLRASLESVVEARWRSRAEAAEVQEPFADGLMSFIEADDGASLAGFAQRKATREQVLELLRWRSIYHLKEADPTSFTLPRLPVRAQAALAALQYDEYGGGDPARLHRHLFATGMSDAGLRPDEGAYVDEAPAIVLEQNNALSMFGLHRRLRGASLGHLAAFEATSSLPSRRMAAGLRRVGLPESVAAYYDEHVEADAVHEQLAVRLICGTLVEDEPETRGDVVLGAFTCLDLENRFATWALERWAA
ncbi:iron-containing redox enzyme family protein [Aeromicrobium sp. Leaf350]|uniref:iron-containing redox enzyme family protein n=1 Tax=Aeromicrobium sp. Leaf350 TaxID=2876565 RepID=UPI001E616372|nr:iron-containing redox enzyme family protein [Aeromicrobium sp. Leaf350]